MKRFIVHMYMPYILPWFTSQNDCILVQPMLNKRRHTALSSTRIHASHSNSPILQLTCFPLASFAGELLTPPPALNVWLDGPKRIRSEWIWGATHQLKNTELVLPQKCHLLSAKNNDTDLHVLQFYMRALLLFHQELQDSQCLLWLHESENKGYHTKCK